MFFSDLLYILTTDEICLNDEHAFKFLEFIKKDTIKCKIINFLIRKLKIHLSFFGRKIKTININNIKNELYIEISQKFNTINISDCNISYINIMRSDYFTKVNITPFSLKIGTK